MNVCVCKEGWFVALGQEKRIACMRGKLGQGVGSWKGGGGGWNLLTSYDVEILLWLPN